MISDRTSTFKPKRRRRASIATLFLCALLFFAPGISDRALADDVCAQVKIQIEQELTLERQAFDAMMRIHNGLEQISLQDVSVVVSFADKNGAIVRATSDPDDTTALFFIRLNSLQNINGVDGTGVVAPASIAEIHWLIIPAPGASEGVAQGTLYYVGATLRYTIGGEEHETTVSPDYIFVKPMPEMTLDYFLPEDVFGDDPFTTEIEEPVPFSLGVRVKNDGTGTARKLKIDSAQPKIVENSQGLAVDFWIIGSEVNGAAATPSLLVDFGDLAPQTCAVARWIMICTLTGRFIEFTADFSHADELGGELTSLIAEVNTHKLVRDVLVDLLGRDAVKDFLARDGDTLRVYESNGVDTVVVNQSAGATIQLIGESGAESVYSFTMPPTAGFAYAGFADPTGGAKTVKELIRSDGKRIRTENFWVSQVQGPDHTWLYRLNLLDANTPGTYTLTFIDPAYAGSPPVVSPIAGVSGAEGGSISFTVSATDPDGTTPSLSASSLPVFAAFTDSGDGTGVFSWTPQVGQAGKYSVTFTASDGVHTGSEKATIAVCAAADSDCDSMDDSWELNFFGTLSRDGTGDFDGDGVSDLDEFKRGTDPTASNAPTTPVIIAPLNLGEVASLRPEVVVENSSDPEGDTISYSFEIFSDDGLTQLVAAGYDLFGGSGTTSWTPPFSLNDNSWYTVRTRASDGKAYSPWAYAKFFVNPANDAPGPLAVSRPKDKTQVDALTPTLEVTNSADVDGDALTYAFFVYSDKTMSDLTAQATELAQGADGKTSWILPVALTDNTWYFWRASAKDEHGLETFTDLSSMFVNTANDAPYPPQLLAPQPGIEVEARDVTFRVGNAVDLDGDALTYRFELDLTNTFDGPGKQVSGPVPEGSGETTWAVSDLSDNTRWFWRARAEDALSQGPWVLGEFFVNAVNDAPSAVVVKNPGDLAWVDSLSPTLEVSPSTDVDGDALSYAFELYAADTPSTPIYIGQSQTPQLTLPIELTDNIWYAWRARAIDEHGLAGSWSASSSFFVDDNGVNDAPLITLLQPASDISVQSGEVTVLWRDEDPDSDALIDLFYAVGADGTGKIPIAQGIEENPDGDADALLWDVSGVPEGVYYVLAYTTDGSGSTESRAPGKVTVDRTAPSVSASPPGGSYTQGRSVTLTASEPATIYYTLDGSDPTTASNIYAAPIDITDSATLKFMAVDPAGNTSDVSTEVYTIETVDRFRVSGEATAYFRRNLFCNRHFWFMHKAKLELDVTGPEAPYGNLEFQYDWALINLRSTEILSVEVIGRSAVIVGKARIHGKPGYTFAATIADGSPDSFGITIWKPQGSFYFRMLPEIVDRGNLAIEAVP